MRAIAVEKVSKRFTLAASRPGNPLAGLASTIRRKRRNDFWALTDVSFEVQSGEAVGIVGHNGAGKSTMLKILTGIMQPTSGRIRTRGRVSALIEVGAGFHPEMTGRENIYLNGTILGMSRVEISRKLDDIISFAEVENFIDTPVKHYSSGMFARLGYSVAAHVEPQILLVDEVLAVGDLAFQQKCFRHMQSLVENGCAVILVTHSMYSAKQLCKRLVWIHEGKVRMDDSADTVAHEYQAWANQASNRGQALRIGTRWGTGDAHIIDAHVLREGVRRLILAPALPIIAKAGDHFDPKIPLSGRIEVLVQKRRVDFGPVQNRLHQRHLLWTQGIEDRLDIRSFHPRLEVI